ncbi:conserved Plasmodium protein, unknown function [Plasmodium gallinaceum]|uniref:MI domain-containing protein n=1 Tax=Plasmodium gallinaceum TaxID=5849 RepID=A0A1J1GT27_PLAGA|nr:conserved Plasmodium protein, unknown function [Plasmodium gallinaceum]CRG95634.1 conserved Plasmodium protein, unknown function [Plasmodium gallinaceum]
MSIAIKKGNLSRKELRKMKRKQKKRNKMLFSKKKIIRKKKSFESEGSNYNSKKEKTKKNEQENISIQLKKAKKVNENDNLNIQLKKSKKVNENKNLNIQLKKAKKVNENKNLNIQLKNDTGDGSQNYDIYAEQDKDDYLLSYLSKKLKIKNNDSSKNNEEKLFKELEKDGFDTKLLKLTDIIFNECQKHYKNNKSSINKTKNDEEYNSSSESNNQERTNNDENVIDNQVILLEKSKNKTETKDKIINKKDKKKKKKLKKISKNEEDSLKNIDNIKKKKNINKESKEIVKIEGKNKKILLNYSEETKKIDKFLIISLNKTSEFNIKSIIQDICKYFHELSDLKLRVIFNDVLIKIVSNYFKNVNTTDIHICIFSVIICVLNSLLYQDLLKDFLKVLIGIFKNYYEDNINLMIQVEKENELNNNLNMNDIEKVNNVIKLNNKNKNIIYDTNPKNNIKVNKKKIITKEEYDKYQDFKIIMRNLLKCFSLFYALNYLDFEFIIDVINLLCESISINNVDNIIIILKICGKKLKKDDVSHLNYISNYLKKQIDNFIIKNNISIEKSKLRFLIKDIEDLRDGKMKFYFLNKFEFLFSVLNEFETKYSFKRNIVYFSFANTFNNYKINEDSDKKKKKNNKINNIDNNDDKKTNTIEDKVQKLNYLMEEVNSNDIYFNKLLKKYKIQGILPKKIFLVIKSSLNVDECVYNLSTFLKKKKNVPFVIQTIIQTLLYDKKYKEAYEKILSNISNVKNRVFLFSLKTVFINYIKNINNYDLKKVLFLSKLFIYLLKEKLLSFQIFKYIEINDEIKLEKNCNLFFFFKTIFILISLDESDNLFNKEAWDDILEIIKNKKINISIIYSFKQIIKKYIFDEVNNITKIYPNFNISYIENFNKILNQQK